MAKPKYDGVIEAVRYDPDGKVNWARTYLRRGPVFSDYILLDRQTLLEHLHAGKRFYIGKRISQMGGVFEVGEPVRVIKKSGQEYLSSGSAEADRDLLNQAPLI